jgi:hypothetical protein
LLSKISDSYRFGVGGHLPTSPQDMASKKDPKSSKMGKNPIKSAEKSTKII